MKRALVSLAALLFATLPASAVEVGSNVEPLSFGKDQTIVDITKVVWGPLNVEGLPKGGEIAVLRGDLAKGEAEALLRFPPGYVVPNHSHTSDELYIWISGAFTLIAHDGTRTAFAGPAYISFPGNAPPHGLECGKAAPCVLFLKYSRPFDIQYFPEPPPKR
ncbi:MAG: hypothetical protein WBP38_01790 [Hyphomicrobium sp.]